MNSDSSFISSGMYSITWRKKSNMCQFKHGRDVFLGDMENSFFPESLIIIRFITYQFWNVQQVV